MRPGTIRTWLGGFATGLLLLASLVRCGGVAHADPSSVSVAYAAIYGEVLCKVLDDHASFGGLIGISQAITEQGLTDYQAGEALALSIDEICPRHSGLLDRFIAYYGPSGVAA